MADISVIRVGSTDYTLKDAEARSDISELYEIKAPKASPSFTGTPLAPTPDINTDNTQIANTAWVNDRIDATMAAAQAMVYKGTIGTGSGDTWVAPARTGGGYYLPSTSDITDLKVGYTYIINTAGEYHEHDEGSSSYKYTCEIGDMVIKVNNNDHNYWTVVQKNIDGAVTGPASSVDSRIAVFNGTTGKVIKDSGYTIAKSVPSNAVFTDTKNTVGSSVTTDKIYFVGVKTSGGTSQTSYVDTGVYSTDGTLKSSKLDVDGDTSVYGTFYVDGTASFDSNVGIGGNLGVLGTITQDGTPVSVQGHTHDNVLDYSDDTPIHLDYSNDAVTTGSFFPVWTGTIGTSTSYSIRKISADNLRTAISAAAASHTHNYAGSSSAGGAATSANKLNTNAGSGTQPVYFSNGVPVATTYTLSKSVPSDAVFTDTKNTVGATSASTQKVYAVGVLESGKGSASAPSYIDQSVTFTDGVIDCDGANIEGNTTIGTASVNRTFTVNGTISSTGAITQGGTAVSLVGHTHSFSGTAKKFAFSGTAGSATASYTPGGSIAVNASTSTTGTAYTPEGSIAVNASSGAGTAYTPEGSVTIGIGDGSSGSEYTPAGTVTVTPTLTSTLTSVKTAGTLPTWSASVSGETLSFSFTQGAMPTFNTGNRASGITSATFTGTKIGLIGSFTGTQKKLAFTGTQKKLAFTGSAATITSSYTPAGTIAINASTGSGTSYTPEGSVS